MRRHEPSPHFSLSTEKKEESVEGQKKQGNRSPNYFQRMRNILLGPTLLGIVIILCSLSTPENASGRSGLSNAIMSVRLMQQLNKTSGKIKALNDYVYTAVEPGNGGMAIGVSNTYSKTLIVQEAVEPLLVNANWVTIPTSALTKVSTNSSAAISGDDIWYTPIHGKWVRVLDTSDVSGEADIQFSGYAAGGGSGGTTGGGGTGGPITISGPLGATTSASSIPVVLPTDPDIHGASGTITVADSGSTVAVGQNGQTLVSGSATAGSTYTLTVDGHASATFYLSGGTSPVSDAEVSVDGSHFIKVPFRIPGTSGAFTSITGNCTVVIDCAGMQSARIRTTVLTGTLSVQGNATGRSLTNAQITPSVPTLPLGATAEKASSNGSPITGTSSTQMFAAAGAGVANHLSWLWFENHSATATEVQILDGATVIGDFYAEGTGGGAAVVVPIQLSFTGTANTAMNIKCATSGASLTWSALGYTQ